MRRTIAFAVLLGAPGAFAQKLCKTASGVVEPVDIQGLITSEPDASDILGPDGVGKTTPFRTHDGVVE